MTNKDTDRGIAFAAALWVDFRLLQNYPAEREVSSMPARRNHSSSPTKRPRREHPKIVYPSLSQGPRPAERRKAVEKRMRQRGITPIEDFDRYLEEVSDFWPQDETCDEFLVWLRRLRREGSS
jgi:hypothetical protein